MDSHAASERAPETDPTTVLGLIHDTVKQVDCIGYLAKRLVEEGMSRGDSIASDASSIRQLTREITSRLRGFLDAAVADRPCADQHATVDQILDHATQLIAIAHPAAVVETTASTSARRTSLPRAVADLLVPLLDNAITHGASPHPTRLIAALAGDRLSLTVADSGPGMPPHTLATCQQLGFSTGPRGRHHGIGLAAVASLTAHMGGTLRIESEPGRGTAVTLELGVVSLQRGARS